MFNGACAKNKGSNRSAANALKSKILIILF
jgi:hypothetical protein